MKKVNWSTRREIVGSTLVVIGIALVISLFCWIWDFALSAFCLRRRSVSSNRGSVWLSGESKGSSFNVTSPDSAMPMMISSTFTAWLAGRYTKTHGKYRMPPFVGLPVRNACVRFEMV